MPISAPEPAAASAAVEALARRAQEADGIAPFSDEARLAARSGRRAVLVARAEAAADAILGATIVGEGELELCVDPAERDRGIGTALVTQALARAEAEAEAVAEAAAGQRAASGSEPGELRAWAHGAHPAAAALAARFGFEPVRTLLVMGARLADLAQPAEQSAPTVASRIRAFRPAADDEAWVRANAEIFAAHPEQGRITVEDLHARMAEPWFDPEDFLVVDAPAAEPTAAGAAGELEAFAWLKVTGEGAQRDGEVYAIGVRSRSAGTGLARALMAAALRRFRDRGCVSTSLYVDEENGRAVNLYGRLGYTVERTSIQYLRP